jgi:hypothetical protein
MSLVARILAVCIGLAALALALGYGLGGLAPVVPALVLVGGLWLLAAWQRWTWAATPGLVLCTAAAGFGVWWGLAADWMLVGLVAALCAWDLDHFRWRLGQVTWSGEAAERRRMLEWHHLQRLGLVAGLGLLLASISLRLRLRLTFLPAVLLGLLIVWGLSQAVVVLRRESD